MRTLETSRFVLRPLQAADLPFFTAVQADPLVGRYLAIGRPRTPAESSAWLDEMLAWERETGFSHLCILARDGRRLGRCGLTVFEIEQRTPANANRPLRAWFGPGSAPADLAIERDIELGYTLDRAAWGDGVATEAARAVRDYAFEEAGLERVISIIHPDNTPSEAVAKKNGLTRFDALELDGKTFYRWVIYREEWERLPR